MDVQLIVFPVKRSTISVLLMYNINYYRPMETCKGATKVVINVNLHFLSEQNTELTKKLISIVTCRVVMFSMRFSFTHTKTGGTNYQTY